MSRKLSWQLGVVVTTAERKLVTLQVYSSSFFSLFFPQNLLKKGHWLFDASIQLIAWKNNHKITFLIHSIWAFGWEGLGDIIGNKMGTVSSQVYGRKDKLIFIHKMISFYSTQIYKLKCFYSNENMGTFGFLENQISSRKEVLWDQSCLSPCWSTACVPAKIMYSISYMIS